jgi:hypothetical protein
VVGDVTVPVTSTTVSALTSNLVQLHNQSAGRSMPTMQCLGLTSVILVESSSTPNFHFIYAQYMNCCKTMEFYT